MAKKKKEAKEGKSKKKELEEEIKAMQEEIMKEEELEASKQKLAAPEKLSFSEAKPAEQPKAEKEEKLLAPIQPEDKEESKKKEVVKAIFARERVLTESSDEARNFYAKSAYGQIIEGGKVQLALPEALYLLEKGKLDIKDGKKKLTTEEFINKARKAEPNFWIRYCVFKDLRNRGYIVKTALKFGADFRVYDRGIKPGEDHARWIVYPVHEGETLTWYEFAAKNRVAHSTKKRLLMAIVDDEGDVTFYEIAWKRP